MFARVFLSMFAVCSAAGLVVAECSAQPGEVDTSKRTGDDQVALSLVRALDIYDKSVGALRWTESLYTASAPGQWREFVEKQVWLGERGEAFTDERAQLTDPDTGGVVHERNVVYRPDPSDDRWFWEDPASGTGQVCGADNGLAETTSPLHLMGRWVDHTNGRRLAEVLQDANSLEYIEPSEDEPWPMVRGEVTLNGQSCRLEVRVDPQHGFAPRIIRWWIEDSGAPAEMIETDDYARIGGVFGPRLGARELYLVMNQRDHEKAWQVAHGAPPDWTGARSLDGLGPIEPAVGVALRRTLARLQRVGTCAKQKELAYAPIGIDAADGTWRHGVVVAQILSVGEDVPPGMFRSTLEPTTGVKDYFRGYETVARVEAQREPVLVQPHGPKLTEAQEDAAWHVQDRPCAPGQPKMYWIGFDLGLVIAPRVFNRVVVEGESVRMRWWFVRFVNGPFGSGTYFHDAACSLPNFEVRGPFMPKDAPKARVLPIDGEAPAPGLHTGEVTARVGPDKCPFRVGVALRVLSRYRAEPPGIILFPASRTPDSVIVDLSARSRFQSDRVPADVRLPDDAPAGLDARVFRVGDRFHLKIQLGGADLAGVAGSTAIEVLDQRGDPLARVPLVWFKNGIWSDNHDGHGEKGAPDARRP